jgi:hypothetical protein
MKSHIFFPLLLIEDQEVRLARLQALFAAACNSITPIVREARCWNRVALHHLAYRKLRAEFPELGSQMACNAIYSVCRAARSVYQNPGSPWRSLVGENRPLPLLKFREDAPVYFDRHTLSLKAGRLSMFTLDGRMKFDADLSSGGVDIFLGQKLKEIILSKSQGVFKLNFSFGDMDLEDADAIPDHIIIEDPSIELLDARRAAGKGFRSSKVAVL